jgi:hypothetical protein
MYIVGDVSNNGFMKTEGIKTTDSSKFVTNLQVGFRSSSRTGLSTDKLDGIIGIRIFLWLSVPLSFISNL